MNIVQFYSYVDAEMSLNLKFPITHELNGDEITGLESVKLITDMESYNYETRNFNRVFVVGCGPKSSPGHPCSHHNPFHQTMIHVADARRTPIHVIHETADGKIMYRGLYQVNVIRRKITAAGWVYTETELLRYKPRDNAIA
jgi:hypothetical protein